MNWTEVKEEDWDGVPENHPLAGDVLLYDVESGDCVYGTLNKIDIAATHYLVLPKFPPKREWKDE